MTPVAGLILGAVLLCAGFATRMYPLEQREPFERSRGELALTVTDCIFCGACVDACPEEAIIMAAAPQVVVPDRFSAVLGITDLRQPPPGAGPDA